MNRIHLLVPLVIVCCGLFCGESLAQRDGLTAYETNYAIQMADQPVTTWSIQYRTSNDSAWRLWRGGYGSRTAAEQALLFAVEHGQFPDASASRIVQQTSEPNWQTVRWTRTRVEAQALIDELRRQPYYADKLFRITPILMRKSQGQLQQPAKDSEIVRPRISNQPDFSKPRSSFRK